MQPQTQQIKRQRGKYFICYITFTPFKDYTRALGIKFSGFAKTT